MHPNALFAPDSTELASWLAKSTVVNAGNPDDASAAASTDADDAAEPSECEGNIGESEDAEPWAVAAE